jgi:hypothetical protein
MEFLRKEVEENEGKSVFKLKNSNSVGEKGKMCEFIS